MVDIIQDFIPIGRRNRPKNPMKPEYLTVHNTANTSPGADALAHAKYLKGGAADIPASWHFTVDDARIVQHLPLDETAYHAGDGGGPGNMKSIGIEICENGDFARAESNAAELISSLLRQFGLGIEKVVPHKKWMPTKNCPRQTLQHWDAFIEQIKGIPTPLPAPETSLLEPPSESSSSSRTLILGKAQCDFDQAQKWARSRGATDDFVALAPVYWYYGDIYGVRADFMYCQSAKEIAFGKFGGNVTPDMYNYAGIKTATATGDKKEDHESFSSAEDGVRHHYVHMCAYLGLHALSEPHARYYVVLKQPWAGTVRYIEDLGGKWAPNPEYGVSIVRDYLQPLLGYKTLTDCDKCQEIVALREKIARIAGLHKLMEEIINGG